MLIQVDMPCVPNRPSRVGLDNKYPASAVLEHVVVITVSIGRREDVRKWEHLCPKRNVIPHQCQNSHMVPSRSSGRTDRREHSEVRKESLDSISNGSYSAIRQLDVLKMDHTRKVRFMVKERCKLVEASL